RRSLGIEMKLPCALPLAARISEGNSIYGSPPSRIRVHASANEEKEIAWNSCCSVIRYERGTTHAVARLTAKSSLAGADEVGVAGCLRRCARTHVGGRASRAGVRSFPVLIGTADSAGQHPRSAAGRATVARGNDRERATRGGKPHCGVEPFERVGAVRRVA